MVCAVSDTKQLFIDGRRVADRLVAYSVKSFDCIIDVETGRIDEARFTK